MVEEELGKCKPPDDEDDEDADWWNDDDIEVRIEHTLKYDNLLNS